MTSRARFCAVILAAGASYRMGSDKALLPWPPASETDTLLSAVILSLGAFAERVLVVAGINAESLAPIAEATGATIVRNPAPERGQFSSMQTGLRAAVDRGCEAAMITPVDSPPLSVQSLQRLCDAFEQAQARGAWAVAPERDGRHGHPLLASRALIEAFLNAPVTSDAREVSSEHADKFEYVALPDVSVARDMNSPEEYAALAEEMGL